MNTKALYAAIAVIILLIVGFVLYNQYGKNNNSNTLSDENAVSNLNTESNPTNDNSNTISNTNTSANTNSDSNMAGHFSGEGDIQGKTVEVDYNGSGFSPSTVTINAGDTVVFKNTSSSTNVWPASDPHPVHTGYPGFDALKTVAPGGIYQFTFTKVGSWGYHNHLNPSQKGTVVVK